MKLVAVVVCLKEGRDSLDLVAKKIGGSVHLEEVDLEET
jgi:hypothetical protein